MLKISCAGFYGLPLAISSQFTLEMCAAAKNCQKIDKNPSFDRSSLFKVIDVDKMKSRWRVLDMISNMSVPICNRFYSRRASSSKWKLSPRLSGTVIKIWRLKVSGVTTLTFWGSRDVIGHVLIRLPVVTSYGWSIVTMRLSGTVISK